MSKPKRSASSSSKSRSASSARPNARNTRLELRAQQAGIASSVRASDVLGFKSRLTVQQIRAGLPTSVIQRLGSRLALSQEKTLASVSISKPTFTRRQQSGRLSVDESDRIWRIADLVAKATELLGDEDEAARWLQSPAVALEGETPLERAGTDIGTRDVTQLMGRLAHGIPT